MPQPWTPPLDPMMSLPLFVPGDRPERIAKAADAGADAVIVDLEDAVAAEARDGARAGLAQAVAGIEAPLLLRINGAGTPWHKEDLAAAAGLPLAGVVLPKAEDGEVCAHVARATQMPVIALIETARGMDALHGIAAASARLAFGSIDYAADLGMGHTREALLSARSALVLAARLTGRPAPLDGVTADIRDTAQIEEDSRHAVTLGMGGKLLIHPAQIAPARRGFAPGEAERDWAARVLAAADTGAAAQVDGAMIDAPVILRARQILARAERDA